MHQTIEALSTFPARLEAYYAAVPDELKHWRPSSWVGIPSERLTAIEQICHVKDIEVDGYQVRFNRVLQEERPVLPDIPGEPLAVERDYANADAAQVLAALRKARAETVSRVAGFTDVQLERVAMFEGTPTTLRGLVHFLCSHDNQHLAGLQWLLAQMQAVRIRA
jgi:DinB superfamily